MPVRVFSFYTVTEVIIELCFSIEVLVKVVSICMFPYMCMQIRNTSGYNIVQYNTTFNYDLTQLTHF